jgi:hypothetical protein
MESVEHTPGFVDALPATSVPEVERALSDWFGAEVILTSSGRAAILLYLTALGLGRYLNRIAVPRLISSCVLDAIIRRGFPVDAEGTPHADATVLYHQYGSLPKFFLLNGMGGGLVMVRGSLARQLRQMRDEASQQGSIEGDSQLHVLRSRDVVRDGSAIEQFYLSRLLNPRILDHQTGGMPATLSEIRTVGEGRQNNLGQLLDALGQDALPVGWSGLLRAAMPFALPVFGDMSRLQRRDALLGEIGVKAGLYKIDVARTMARPRYQTAVLVPCYHEMPPAKLNDMAGILKEVSGTGDRLK